MSICLTHQQVKRVIVVLKIRKLARVCRVGKCGCVPVSYGHYEQPCLVRTRTLSHKGNAASLREFGVSNFKDFAPYKTNYGLSNNVVPDVKLSVDAGIRDLATKGFHGGIGYDAKTNTQTFTFKGWENAVNRYNAGGAAKYGQDYSGSIFKMYNNSKAPTPANY